MYINEKPAVVYSFCQDKSGLYFHWSKKVSDVFGAKYTVFLRITHLLSGNTVRNRSHCFLIIQNTLRRLLQ